MEDLSEEGHWWIEGNKEEAVGGVLSMDSDGGASLQLFDLIDRNAVSRYVTRDRIFGVSTEGEAYTLLNCHRGGYTRGDPFGGEETYSVQYVIRGVHWGQSTNISFDEIDMGFPLLDQWSSVHTTTSANPFPLGLDPGDSFDLTHTLPTSLKADLMSCSVKISEQMTHNTDRILGDSAEFSTQVVMDFTKPSVPFWKIRDYVDFIRYLLTIAYNKPVSPQWISGRNKNLFEYQKIEIFYPLPGPSEVSNRPLDQDFYFTPDDISGGLQALTQNWAELWENHRSMIDMYLSGRYNENMYLQSEFLSLVQAIEAFHRRKYDSKYIPESRYSEVKDHLMELIRGDPKSVYATSRMVDGSLIPDNILERLQSLDSAYGIGHDLGNKLNSTLKYANELSLRRRLNHLVNTEYDTIIEGLPHSAEGEVHAIVETRNHYVHQLKDPGPAVREGGDLIDLTFPLRQLIEAIVLNELGLPENFVKQKLRRRYSQIVRL